MAISFFTANPEGLLSKLDTAIAQSEQEGKDFGWIKIVDSGRVLYTSTRLELFNRGWLQPKIENDRLTFFIVKPTVGGIRDIIYIDFQVGLLKLFLNCFKTQFTSSTVSSIPQIEEAWGTGEQIFELRQQLNDHETSFLLLARFFEIAVQGDSRGINASSVFFLYFVQQYRAETKGDNILPSKFFSRESWQLWWREVLENTKCSEHNEKLKQELIEGVRLYDEALTTLPAR